MLTRPVEIVFHRLEPSPSVENLVLELTEKLERLTPDVSSLRVVIDTPHRHGARARYSVKIEMRYAGLDLVIHHADRGDAGFDVYRAVRDGFVRAMRLAVETAQTNVLTMS
jgi:hypothetical protein